MSENYDHNRTNRNKQHMRENLTARICVIGLDARKFSCAKISMFTVTKMNNSNLPLDIAFLKHPIDTFLMFLHKILRKK